MHSYSCSLDQVNDMKLKLEVTILGKSKKKCMHLLTLMTHLLLLLTEMI